MSAVPSSSTRLPVDTTFSVPVPTERTLGWIRLRPSASLRASSRSGMPSMRGTEKPQMSASSTPTVWPRAAMAAARFTVTELLPTPPLPEAMASTRVVAGMRVSGASSRAAHRAFTMTPLRSSLVISPHVMSTVRTPGWVPMRVSTSLLIWPRSGQPAIVSFTVRVTVPSAVTATSGTMPRVTMSLPSSGSITPRSSPVTSSTLGAGAVGSLDFLATSAFYRPSPCKIGPCVFPGSTS